MVTSRFSPITHALSFFFRVPHFDLSIARAGKLRAMAYNNNNNNNPVPVFYLSSLTHDDDGREQQLTEEKVSPGPCRGDDQSLLRTQ
jgi:hypothetical protein